MVYRLLNAIFGHTLLPEQKQEQYIIFRAAFKHLHLPLHLRVYYCWPLAIFRHERAFITKATLRESMQSCSMASNCLAIWDNPQIIMT
jgi:hypothetical protein